MSAPAFPAGLLAEIRARAAIRALDHTLLEQTAGRRRLNRPGGYGLADLDLRALDPVSRALALREHYRRLRGRRQPQWGGRWRQQALMRGAPVLYRLEILRCRRLRARP
jgi:hypothetical protein